MAANLYRDNQLNLEGVDRRMKRLIDEYVSAQGIDPRIAPVAISDINFLDQAKRKKNARARASEMKHALRHQIRLRYDEDPAHFRKLSERLEAIIQQLKNNWKALEKALRKFIREELEREGKQTVPGLDPRLHAPFFGTLKEAIEKEQGQEWPEDEMHNVTVTSFQALTTDIAMMKQKNNLPSPRKNDPTAGEILLYQTEYGETREEVRLAGRRIVTS